jgi:hypothetical protein
MSATKRKVIKYLIASIICFVLNLVYGAFSHNVSSIFMTYAFVIPLIGLLLSLLSNNITYRNFLASSIFTITLASLLEGVVVIAGTTTIYVYVLLSIGIIMFIISLFFIKKKAT